MAQLSTAGGLTSTLPAPAPMRLSSTGAGAPQTSWRTGWEISTSAAIGASSLTHSRKPAIISASDQASGLGGSGRLGRFAGSGVAADALLLSFSATSGCSAAGLMVEVLCAGEGSPAPSPPDGLRPGPRAPRSELEGRLARSVLGQQNRFGRHDLDCRGACRRTHPRHGIVRQERQRRETKDRGDRQLGRHGIHGLGQEPQHPCSLRHALY